MKKLSTFLALLALVTYASAQVSRPIPADSRTNARAINNFVYPSTTGFVSQDQLASVTSNIGGVRNWSSYFLGQAKVTYTPFETTFVINPDGTGTIFSPYASSLPFQVYGSAGFGYSIGNGCGGTISFGARPLYTNEALRTGGAPYDWVVDENDSGCVRF